MSNIRIEVVYALPNHQYIISLILPKGSSVEQAIKASGILSLQPEIDFKINKVGIFSKVISLKELLSNGDRIEIYRPLLINPKDRLRLRTS